VPTSAVQHEDQVLAESLAGAVPSYEYMHHAILGICVWIRRFGSQLGDHELLVKRNLQLPLDGNNHWRGQNAYDKLDNRIVECLILHVARLLDKVK